MFVCYNLLSLSALQAPPVSRRVLATGLVAAAATAGPAAAAEPTTPALCTGTVALQPGLAAEADSDLYASAALYVTARLVPEANKGLYVQGGKVPPLAAARFAGPLSFPFRFSLSTADLTPEFAAVSLPQVELQDLVVSARLDTDGVAATRGPDDLVGRATLLKGGSADSAGWRGADVVLQARGLTGRILTAPK